jgi:hypothetical protein
VPYVRESFWRGRDFDSLIAMVDGAMTWSRNVADRRRHRILDATVGEASCRQRHSRATRRLARLLEGEPTIQEFYSGGDHMDDDRLSDGSDPIVSLLEALSDDPVDEEDDETFSEHDIKDVVWMLDALGSSVYDPPVQRSVDRLIDSDEALTPVWRQSLIRRADVLLVNRRLTRGAIQPLLRYARHQQGVTPQNVAEATGLAAELVPAVETGEVPITRCQEDRLVAWTRLLSINARDVLQSLYRSCAGIPQSARSRAKGSCCHQRLKISSTTMRSRR